MHDLSYAGSANPIPFSSPCGPVRTRYVRAPFPPQELCTVALDARSGKTWGLRALLSLSIATQHAILRAWWSREEGGESEKARLGQRDLKSVARGRDNRMALINSPIG